jgi:ribosomal protein L30E
MSAPRSRRLAPKSMIPSTSVLFRSKISSALELSGIRIIDFGANRRDLGAVEYDRWLYIEAYVVIITASIPCIRSLIGSVRGGTLELSGIRIIDFGANRRDLGADIEFPAYDELNSYVATVEYDRWLYIEAYVVIITASIPCIRSLIGSVSSCAYARTRVCTAFITDAAIALDPRDNSVS